MKSIPLLLIASLLSLGATNCAHPVKLDPEMSALAANDFTGLIESTGCRFRLEAGFAVCRKTEGDAADLDKIAFLAPPAECGEESCASIKVLFPDGSPSIEKEFKKGQTRIELSWSDLLKTSKYQIDARGFWGFVYTIKFLDPNRNPRTTKTQGEIYMRVTRRGYNALFNSADNESYVWKWTEDGAPVRMTTGGRTFVGGEL